MMITISLNKELDYEVYKDFCNYSTAGVNFGEKIKITHPHINLENHKEYIDNFYLNHQSEILNKMDDINLLLHKKQDQFLLELKKIFDIDFSHYTYNGYLSIFNCNPRYIDTKTFQIFYDRDSLLMLKIAFHESLHFAFFEYFDKNFSEKTNSLDKNSGILWEMSEIVNVIILNLPSIKGITDIEEKLFYPELQDKLNRSYEIWNSCVGIKDFISEYLHTFAYQ